MAISPTSLEKHLNSALGNMKLEDTQIDDTDTLASNFAKKQFKYHEFGDVHKGGVWRVRSVGPKKIASASYDHSACLWDLPTSSSSAFEPAMKILKGNKKEVLSIANDDAGKRFITGSAKGIMKVYSLDGKLLKTLQETNSTGFYSLCYIGKDLVVSGACQKPDKVNSHWDHEIRVWNLKEDTQPILIGTHAGGISSLVSIKSNQIASASADATLGLWDIEKRASLFSFTGHIDYVYGLSYNCEKEVLFSGSRDKKIMTWDPKTGKKIGSLCQKDSLSAHTSTVYDVDATHFPFVFSASRDGTVKTWDMRTCNVLRSHDAYSGFVYSVAGFPDGSCAVGTAGKKKEEKSGEVIFIFAAS